MTKQGWRISGEAAAKKTELSTPEEVEESSVLLFNRSGSGPAAGTG
jgi:hypothetical protein